MSGALCRLATGATALIAATTVAAAGATPHATPHATRPNPTHRPSLAVTGFQEEGTPPSRITTDAAALHTVGVDGVDINAAGSRVGTPDAGAIADERTAHRDHLQAAFLVGNYDDAISDFSEAWAHSLLSSTAHRRAVARSLARSVKMQDWDGVSVDLESLRGRDRAGLTAFLRTLQADLPAGKTLTVCVTSFTAASTYRANGYDLAAIGRTVSQVVVMAYDEHGSWENTPGPVGALGWQRRGLRVVLQSVPAAKIDLGVAGYGYAWRPHSNYQVSDAGARRLVARDHGTSRFDRTAGEWTARLPDGSTLWWSDARSYPLRVSLAKRLGLHGLAVWDLGLSDRLH